MANNTFTLLNDGDIIDVRPNTTTKDVQTTVNGSDGKQTVYIHAGVSGVDLTATMERADFSFKASDVSFRMNPEGKLEVIYNNSLIASIANNSASGTDLAFTDGKINVKAAQDDAGNLVFQLKGDSSAAPQNIPADGSQASLSIPLDSSSKSALADGGDTPVDPTENILTVAQYNAHLAAGTLPADYTLEDSLQNLGTLGYSITKALKVAIKDDIENVVSGGELTSAAKNLATLDTLSGVTLQGGVKALMEAELPAEITAKTVKYVVDEQVPTALTLNDITVAAAVAGPQKQVNDFLAGDNVSFVAPAAKPTEAVKVSSYTVRDDAENIAKAAEGEGKAALLAAKDVTMADTMQNVATKANQVALDVTTKLTVQDTLKGFADAGSLISDTLLNQIVTTVGAANVSFTATDKADKDVVKADVSALLDFAESNAVIKLEDAANVKTIELSTTEALVGEKGASLALDAAKIFTIPSSAKVNLTASDQDDNLIINGSFDTINLGAGDDDIVLGDNAAVTTINLGDGTNSFGADTAISKAVTVTNINGGADDDMIDLSNTTGFTSSGSITINGKGGADVITLGSAKETVVLGDGVELGLGTQSGKVTLDTTGANILSSTATLIKGTFTSSTDQIAFTGDLAKMLGATSFTDSNFDATASSKHGTIVSNKITLPDSTDKLVTADSAEELATKFSASTNTNDGLISFLTTGQKAILLTNSAATTGKALNIWYVEGGANTTSADDDTIVLLGTVVTSAILAADDFTTVESA